MKPLGALEVWEGVDQPPIIILFFSKKIKVIFSRGNFSWNGGDFLSPPKKVINLPRTSENLLCKGESYWFSGYLDPRQTDVLLLL